jgi:hypothetical protein
LIGYFVTVCEKNVIRLWTKRTKKSNENDKNKAKEFWAQFDELAFKEANIVKVQGYKAPNGSKYLIFNSKNHITLWVNIF